MKIASLARGHSGVRRQIVEALIALVNAGIVPCIPAKGSVGASGDLAPLSHLTLALLGEGEVQVRGQRYPAARAALAAAGISPVVLGAKEGLALINGTQISAALALHGLFMAERVFEAAVVVRCDGGRCGQGQRRPFRFAAARTARTARTDRDRARLPRTARRQRDPRVASGQRRPRAGSRTVCAASRRSWARASI